MYGIVPPVGTLPLNWGLVLEPTTDTTQLGFVISVVGGVKVENVRAALVSALSVPPVKHPAAAVAVYVVPAVRVPVNWRKNSFVPVTICVSAHVIADGAVPVLTAKLIVFAEPTPVGVAPSSATSATPVIGPLCGVAFSVNVIVAPCTTGDASKSSVTKIECIRSVSTLQFDVEMNLKYTKWSPHESVGGQNCIGTFLLPTTAMGGRGKKEH
jgi:hypothetical protein